MEQKPRVTEETPLWIIIVAMFVFASPIMIALLLP